MPAVDRIETLRPDGIEGSTFGIYRTGAVRVLRAHATRPCGARRFRNTFPPDGLPAYLSTICAQAANPGECSGLRGLWKAIRRAGGLDLGDDPSADDLLAPATWARIAALPGEDRGPTAGNLGTYRRAARRLLRRHATRLEVPTPVTLPPRPSEIRTAARSKDERTGVHAIWRAIRRVEVALTKDPSPDDVLAPEVWAQTAAFPSEALGLAPSTWKTYRAAAARALRRHAAPPAKLPAKRQDSCPDRRLRGNMALPVVLAAELDAMVDLMGYAPNSQRALRSTVTRRFTSAHGSGVVTMAATLKDMLEVDGQRLPETGATPRQQAAVESLRAAMRLAEAPAWRELQSAVVAAGVVPVGNPVPALFEAAGETLAAPRDLTREWAWQHDRGLRPDLRITFAAAIDRLDALRAIPVLTGSGLLPPEPLGPMPSRGGRHVHAVYPLPRPIEAAVAELDVSAAERRSLEASVHFVWRQARDVGLHAAGDAPTAEELLSESTVGQLRAMATGRAQRDAWREHMPRLRALVPVEEKPTPRARWEGLFAAARTLGLSPAALVPIDVVKSAALANDLGPDELSRTRAMAAVAAAPRAGANALNRGLRILDALREAIPPGLIPTAPVSDGRPVKLA